MSELFCKHRMLLLQRPPGALGKSLLLPCKKSRCMKTAATVTVELNLRLLNYFHSSRTPNRLIRLMNGGSLTSFLQFLYWTNTLKSAESSEIARKKHVIDSQYHITLYFLHLCFQGTIQHFHLITQTKHENACCEATGIALDQREGVVHQLTRPW